MKKIIFVFYALTLLLFTWFSYAFVDQNLVSYQTVYSGFATQERLITTSLYTFFILFFFGCYFLLLRSFIKKKIASADIKYLLILTCSILLFSYPTMLSYDIFNYTTTAKVLFHYQENPYIIMPIAFTSDPFLSYTHAANKIALYGPVWLFLTGIPYGIGLLSNFFVTLVSFKLFVALFYLLTVYLLWLFTKNTYAVMLFAFNPLVVIETFVSGHNDVVMMFFSLFSFFLIKQKKYLLAFCFFAASVLIKYATIVLLPVFVYLLWQGLRNQHINWTNIFFFSALAMLFIFGISPLREEMYPWYAIWFLTFAFLVPEKKILLYFSLALSFGLLLRYIPFMYSGTHFGQTPLFKILLTSIPIVLAGVLYVFRRKLLKSV